MRKKKKIKYELNRLRSVRRKNKLKAMYRRMREKRKTGFQLVSRNPEKRVMELK